MLALLITFVVLLITYFLKNLRRPKNYPPGPAWLPIVGNLPLLKRLSKRDGGQYIALYNLAKEYNTNVLGLKLGSNYVVTVFSYPVVKSVLTSEEYDGRPNSFFIRLRCMGIIRGITCTDGNTWMVQRSFVVRHLRELGFGKPVMENMIKDELSAIIDTLSESSEDIKIGRCLAPSILNVLLSLIGGSRISRDNKNLMNLLELFNRRSKAFDMSGGTLSQHPWLRFIAPERSGYNIVNQVNNELKTYFMTIIEQHIADWQEDRKDDLIYAYITEMKKEKHDSSFYLEQLLMVCLDLFIAGSETTSNTIDFAILMMLLHPEIQKKAQKSIDSSIDKNKDLSYVDRLKLPYIEAILMEIERFCHVAPVIGPRRVTRDTVLDKYYIPKDTTILISLYSVHMSPEIWGDPEVFRPERFLDEEGKITSHEKFIPFGLGRRRCLGEVLARASIFLFFTGILRNFQIQLPKGCKMPSSVPVPGITLSPKDYKIHLKRRT